jgi:hypothetical protein
MSALDVQVGGAHYKEKGIQPVTYIHANKLNFLEGCIVKRITRWRDKNGLEDLLKIKHEVDLLIELEGLAVPVPAPASKPAHASETFYNRPRDQTGYR